MHTVINAQASEVAYLLL